MEYPSDCVLLRCSSAATSRSLERPIVYKSKFHALLIPVTYSEAATKPASPLLVGGSGQGSSPYHITETQRERASHEERFMQNCKKSDIDHVRKFVAYAKSTVNDARYYPPLLGYRYIVALALYSKCITVAEATVALLDSGFSDEAFGMTRTLVDIFITLHYIANKDTDERSQRYYQFIAKDSEVWSEVVATYWPEKLQPMHPRMQSIASTYPSPHRWSGKNAKEMALEPDTIEIDPATAKATVHDFAYRVIYRWTSHYVHPTVVALENHVVQAGHDNFIVHSGRVKDKSNIAVFNIACYVTNTMVSFYRCMGDPQPRRVSSWANALREHLVREHN